MKKITNSEKETFDFAKKYAQKLKGGKIIWLIGNLGAGKTVFTKGLAQGLGVKKVITSPTFVLMKVYPIDNKKLKIKSLVHIDAYRIDSESDLASVGIEEYLDRDDVVMIVEWADKIYSYETGSKMGLPRKMQIIEIKIKSKNKREIIY